MASEPPYGLTERLPSRLTPRAYSPQPRPATAHSPQPTTHNPHNPQQLPQPHSPHAHTHTQPSHESINIFSSLSNARALLSNHQPRTAHFYFARTPANKNNKRNKATHQPICSLRLCEVRALLLREQTTGDPHERFESAAGAVRYRPNSSKLPTTLIPVASINKVPSIQA
jgi:hypothetical protein